MSTDVPQSPSSRSSRRIIFALALIVTAISLAYWSWSNRQDLAAESVAAKTLQDLGAVVVMDGERRHVASVNLSTLQSPQSFAKAIQQLPSLTHITSLDASRTAISDEQLATVANLPKLNSLSLVSTAVTDDGVRWLGRLRSLQSLYLTSTGITDRSLPVIAELDELRILDVSATQVTADLEPLVQLPQLEWLVLRKLSLEDGALPNLSGCQTLKRLSLDESKYSADSLTKLQRARPELSVDQ